MKKLQVGIVLCGVLMLAGCASAPTMDRTEFLSATSRTYDGVTEDEFFAAAKKLFVLADESDVKFVYPDEHSMIVQHKWSIFYGLGFTKGIDVWRVATTPAAKGLTARVYVSQYENSMAMAPLIGPTGVNSTTTFASAAPANAVVTPAIYGLFWGRMDYLLGRADEWSTCEAWDQKIGTGATYGDLGALCGFPIDDAAPALAARP